MKVTRNFIRNHILRTPSYQPIVPFDVLSEQLDMPAKKIIKLDANENPYGPVPEVGEALSRLAHINIYPDPESRYLRKALSDYHKIPFESILVGAGADELIDLIIRVLIDPGDVLVNCPPTFGMYAFDGAVNNAKIISIPRNTQFEIDLKLIEETVFHNKPKLIFLASPNNPDGSLLNKEILLQLLALPVIIVVDEAYIDFASPGSTMLKFMEQYENLVIL